MKVKSVLQINKAICSMIAVVMMVLLFSTSAFAKAYVQNWNLVDSGKHLDYDGNSTYMSYIKTGASTWNAYKSGVIRPDSALVIQDVYVSDVNSANGWAGSLALKAAVRALARPLPDQRAGKPGEIIERHAEHQRPERVVPAAERFGKQGAHRRDHG